MTFKYTILCTSRGCQRPAQYKIASRWSDGLTEELKTYALTCEDCLPTMFRQSLEKQKQCHLAQGEILEPPGIFKLEPGWHDAELQRLTEIEETMAKSE